MQYQLFITLLVMKSVSCLLLLDDTYNEHKDKNAMALNRIVQLILESTLASKGRRTLTQAKETVSNPYEDEAVLVEKELKVALSQKSSALLDRPYVEKEGRNDYLVLRPIPLDSHVTVVPNAINYNIEKKCVNWLDDCSLQGIRNRLLKRIRYPYK